jgi:hypothetical protein
MHSTKSLKVLMELDNFDNKLSNVYRFESSLSIIMSPTVYLLKMSNIWTSPVYPIITCSISPKIFSLYVTTSLFPVSILSAIITTPSEHFAPITTVNNGSSVRQLYILSSTRYRQSKIVRDSLFKLLYYFIKSKQFL